MRLKNYILREARVKKSDADVFLREYAPIFAWNRFEGFLWAVYNDNTNRWDLYRNNKIFNTIMPNDTMISHPTLISKHYNRVINDEDIIDWIRGRISPDGKTIYVHDLDSREMIPSMSKRFDYYVNKAIDDVYKYMEDWID